MYPYSSPCPTPPPRLLLRASPTPAIPSPALIIAPEHLSLREAHAMPSTTGMSLDRLPTPATFHSHKKRHPCHVRQEAPIHVKGYFGIWLIWCHIGLQHGASSSGEVSEKTWLSCMPTAGLVTFAIFCRSRNCRTKTMVLARAFLLHPVGPACARTT